MRLRPSERLHLLPLGDLKGHPIGDLSKGDILWEHSWGQDGKGRAFPVPKDAAQPEATKRN